MTAVAEMCPARSCFRDRNWGRAGQLLAIATRTTTLETVPEVLARVNSAQFPTRFQGGDWCYRRIFPDVIVYVFLH